ncbi:MAG: protein kinase [Candidatus Wallbacteria bacterium]|nr:protein kinase [Candidatus Wallbacteria bacterium]
MVTIPGYTIETELASGASATVYRAVQTGLSRPVAIKLLAPGLFDAEETRVRFLREARIQAGLSHPNLLALFDAGFTEDRPYLVCELVTGGSIRDRLERLGARPPREAASWLGAAAAAMAHAHNAGIVHRDLKPENLLLTGEDVVKVADFGLAKAQLEGGSLKTAAGVLLGTPGYMAPEVLRGKPATAAADVYALGVILFELLLGHRPFAAADMQEEVSAQLRRDSQELARLTSPLPPALGQLVLRCLAPEPTSRPSADELASELAALTPQALKAPRAVRAATRVSRGSGQLQSAVARTRSSRELPSATPPFVAAAGGKRAPLAAAVGLALVLAAAAAWPRRQEPPPPAPAEAPPAVAKPAPTPPRVAQVSTSHDRARVWLAGGIPKQLILSFGPSGSSTPSWSRLPISDNAKSAMVAGLKPDTAYTGALEWPGGRAHLAFRTRRVADLGGGTATYVDSIKPDNACAIAAAGETIYAAWRRDLETRKLICTAESPDGGVTWTEPQTLPDDPGANSRIALAADGTSAAVAWVLAKPAGDTVQIRFRRPDQPAWSPPLETFGSLHDPGLAPAGGGRFDLLTFGPWAPGNDVSIRWADVDSARRTLRSGKASTQLVHRHASRTCAILLHSGRRLLAFSQLEDDDDRKTLLWTHTLDPDQGPWAPVRSLVAYDEGMKSDVDAAAANGTVAVAYSVPAGVRLCVSQDDGAAFRTVAVPFREKYLQWEPAVAIAGGTVYVAGVTLDITHPAGPAIVVFYRSRDLVSWEPAGKVVLPMLVPKVVRFVVLPERIVALIVNHREGIGAFTLPLRK